MSGNRSADDLSVMLNAQSVAVIGASPRRGSVGHHVIRQLAGGGFSGTVVPVNPRYSEIDGLASAEQIEDVGPVDLAVIAVGNEQLFDQAWAAVDAGARSLAIFASCHGSGPAGGSLFAELGSMVREAGVPVCGGNGMGFVNVEGSLRVCGYYQPFDLTAGGVTFLTHSGSLFSAMLHNRRRLDFNFVASTGNELGTTMDQYLAYAVSLPSTRTIGLFLETVRNPQGMSRALSNARSLEIPVVALKVGKTMRARAAVATHTAAVAGEYGGFEAFADAHGVHLVESMDEFADALQLFGSGMRAEPGGLGAIHDSGGERSLLIDLADRAGVPLATLGDGTRRRVSEVLEPGLEPDNPIDAWGTGREAFEIVGTCMDALDDDDDVAAIAFCVDLTAEEVADEAWTPVAISAAASLNKPLLVLANLASAVDPNQASQLADAGVPLLYGTETGLRAIAHLFSARDRRHEMPGTPADPPSDLEIWRKRLAGGEPLYEFEALSLLSDFGLPAVRSRLASSDAEMLACATSVGWPLVMKTAAPVAHKAQVGGVEVGIESEAALRLAYERLRRLDDRVLIQPMADGGVEFGLGLARDEQFGLVLMVAAGGNRIEELAHRSLTLAPVSEVTARRLIGRIVDERSSGRAALDGPGLSGIVDSVLGLSSLAHHLGDVIESLDINPVIVSPSGATVVDALAFGRPGTV